MTEQTGTPQVLAAFNQNLYEPGFTYCNDRDFAKTVKTPCLILAGNDAAHPWEISEELSKLLPNNEFIAEWKAGSALTSTKARIKEFLAMVGDDIDVQLWRNFAHLA